VKRSSNWNWCNAVGVLLIIAAPQLAWAPVLPVEPPEVPPPSETNYNEFGPDGERCPGACGAGCSENCEQETFKRCHSDNPQVVVTIAAFTCGTSPACTDFENCLRSCKTRTGTDGVSVLRLLLGVEDAWAPVIPVPPDEEPDFDIADCQSQCAALVGNSAAGLSLGYGPYEDSARWEYSRDFPDAPDNTESCGECELCQDGECVRDPEACPEPDPPPSPPAPPALPLPPDPPVPSISSGDVHISTLDGLRFNFQAVGEFLLIEAEDHDLAVQFRTRASGSYVSVNSAAAMQVAGDVVGFYVEPHHRVVVDGETVAIDEGGTMLLDGGGKIHHVASNRYQVVWPDSSVVEVTMYPSTLSIGGRLADGLAGMVRGVAGDFDGDPGNDLVTPEGERFGTGIGYEELYDIYGHSWRITQEDSLFEYGPGETTETYTDRDFPRQRITLAALDELAVAAAEEICAPIRHPRIYRDCVLDVAVTGDPIFLHDHLNALPPSAEVAPTYFEEEIGGEIGIEIPPRVPAGSRFEVEWSGTRNVGDFVAVAERETEVDDYLTYRVVTAEGAVGLYAPDAPGDYVVRYIQGLGVAAEQPIEVEEAVASLQAEEARPSGSEIEVAWQGPGNTGDFISIARPDQPGSRYVTWGSAQDGNPLVLTVPDSPERYEIRYVQGQSGSILERRELRVTPRN